MKRKNIFSVLMVTLFLGAALLPLSGAVELNADINVQVSSFIGLVSPRINVTSDEQKNQSLELLVNVTEPVGDPDNNSYIVEDKIVINLNINDESGRDIGLFVLPRLVFYRVVVARDIKTAFKLPGSFLNNWMPIKAPFSSVGVVDTISGGKAENITIPAHYRLTNDSYYAGGENFTMYITVMGFLPGNVNGFLDGKIPIIDREIVNLEVTYKNKWV